VYELDTLRHKARQGLEQLSLVILRSCTNKSETTIPEQCQVAAGSIWDGPPPRSPSVPDPARSANPRRTESSGAEAHDAKVARQDPRRLGNGKSVDQILNVGTSQPSRPMISDDISRGSSGFCARGPGSWSPSGLAALSQGRARPPRDTIGRTAGSVLGIWTSTRAESPPTPDRRGRLPRSASVPDWLKRRIAATHRHGPTRGSHLLGDLTASVSVGHSRFTMAGDWGNLLDVKGAHDQAHVADRE
jgi:hypothetical protein